jgi:hypothetical protein
MVPMFTCGFERSNFSLAMMASCFILFGDQVSLTPVLGSGPAYANLA